MRSERCLWLAVTAAALVTSGGAAAPDGSLPTVCFAPGTDPGYVRRTYAALQPSGGTEAPIVSLFQFNPGARWTTTASAGGLGQGAPTVLTWSVVPDGLFI